MAERIDYDKVATSVNYPALEKKLDELRKKEPPQRRKKAADVLAPVTDTLLDMHTKGWSYQQLVAELKTSGLLVTVSALRRHLTGAAKRRKAVKKSAAPEAHKNALRL